MSRSKTNAFAFRPMSSAIALVAQLAQTSGDVHQTAKDSLNSSGAVRPRRSGGGMQAESLLRLFD